MTQAALDQLATWATAQGLADRPLGEQLEAAVAAAAGAGKAKRRRQPGL